MTSTIDTELEAFIERVHVQLSRTRCKATRNRCWRCGREPTMSRSGAIGSHAQGWAPPPGAAPPPPPPPPPPTPPPPPPPPGVPPRIG